MVSPFRTAPPWRAQRQLIDRPRLVEVLDGRFERRLTVVRGGAGFGKTTLLVQALEANREDPLGVDLWLSCGPQDDRASEFGAGLCEVVGVEVPRSDPVRAICDAIWRESPVDIALVLDDVHHLRANGSGAGLLGRLLRELPENGHLVLTSRSEVPMPIARLIAGGEACVIDEAELAFDTAERGSFLALRGAPSIEGEWAGWPAILELAATAGGAKVGAYLWEEVLSGLSNSRRRDLARLGTLDWFDADRIEAFTGRREEVAEFAADLPLTSFEGDGAARLHGLWQPVLSRIDPGWTAPALERAVRHLTRTGYHREALALCLHLEESEMIPVVVRDLVHQWQSTPPATLETVLAMLPADVRDAPMGQLLEGLHRMRTDPGRALPFLEAAREGLARADDLEAQHVALTGLAMLGFSRADGAALASVYAQASKLGLPQSVAGMKLIESAGALVQAQPVRALELVEEARQLWPDFQGQDGVNAFLACLDAGQPERALAEIQAALPGAAELARAALLSGHFDARWLSGQGDPQELVAFDDELPESVVGHTHNVLIYHAVLGIQNASAGRLDAARVQLERATALLEGSLGPRADMVLAVSEMVVKAAGGDEAGARAVIEACFARVPEESLIHRHSLRGAAIASIVSPRIREIVHGWTIGPCYALGLAAGDALLALRDSGDPAPAAALDWRHWRRFSVFLVPSYMLELALGAAAAGDPDAAKRCEVLAVDHRAVLRRLAKDGPSILTDAAGDLLRRVPARPAGRLEIRVLGALELRRDGKPIEDPALRRDRVRALLHFLVARRSFRREEMGVAVWPDLDERAMANNLRVNLNHVHHLLEPERQAGEPSFFLPQIGDQISLRTGDGLEVDVDRFEEGLARAEQADASGDPASALEAYETALGSYRGEYLEGAFESDWASLDRTRLRSSFVRASLRAAALRMGHGDFDASLGWIRGALLADDLAEAGYRMQALVYLRQEDRAAARAALASGMKRLVDAGLDPEPETLRIARRLGLSREEARGQA